MMCSRKKKDLIYVGIQVLLFISYLFVPAPVNVAVNQITRIVGLALLIVGTGIFLAGLFQLRKSLTPFPSVRSDGHLVTNGIYRFIRHPLYTGIIAGLFGYGLYSIHTGRLTIVVLLAVLFYFKSIYEERMLLTAYPDYKQYRLQTGRFLPKWKNVIDVLFLRDKYH
ncbi:isoprenylcysteine carboxylmethyltransferase family protein [Dyadobacter sp. NIV53]|uniref:methyltransferase family protein n=1 Tax=Dyadobacter sp. NIV53 TaxID=2861765 RepID=UPI001C87A2B4|nr:isoprenylcysteine carboxylmethyltransferase family protein [Dyadobacter sp. NIV53]